MPDSHSVTKSFPLLPNRTLIRYTFFFWVILKGIEFVSFVLFALIIPKYLCMLVYGVQCDVEKLPDAVVCRTLSRGNCGDSCGHGCAD